MMVAFLVAVGAAETGRATLMFLTKEAVRLAVDGTAIGVACDGCPPIPDLMKRYEAAGGALLRLPDLLQRQAARRRRASSPAPRSRAPCRCGTGSATRPPPPSATDTGRKTMTSIDVEGLRDKVKAMYQAVADEPQGTFHFEMGYGLAARLGYPTTELDQIPPEAIESFAGVGHHLALADLQPGDRVVDLGSGSGTDAFLAARQVGADGQVIGIDMTDAQLAKARRLAERDGFANDEFEKGYIEQVPVTLISPPAWSSATA